MFEIIPAVDIRKGKCVQLVQGKVETEKSFGDPLEVAKTWEVKGANRLHIVDLDGAINGKQTNLDLILDIIDQVDIPVEVGGGIRKRNTASLILNSGADRIIIGTEAFKSKNKFLKPLIKDLERGEVFVSIDAYDREVMVRGWKNGSGVDFLDAAIEFENIGVDGLLLTDISSEGKLEGIDLTKIIEVVESVEIPVIASGGISSINDVIQIRDIGTAGVIIGTALYESKLELSDLLSLAN